MKHLGLLALLPALFLGSNAISADNSKPASSAARKRPVAPKQEEWKKDGAPYLLARTPHQCSALKLREWIRVRCEEEWAHRGYVKAGPTEGVEIWQGKFEKGLFAAFPFQPGDRRVIVFTFTEGVGKYGALEAPGYVISMTWLEGEEPIIVVD